MAAPRPRFLSAHDAAPLANAWKPESDVRLVAAVAAGSDGGDAAQGAEVTPLLEQVTLIVYGWRNVEPGTLSWVFPSLTAALAAAHAMTNATRWQIVAGSRQDGVDVERERSSGTVLVEEAG
jgi:hypothetical protein